LDPLKGLNVVSLEQAVAAPLCTSRLALAGAQVFKIERPEGDFARFYDSAVAGQSAYFVWLNAGKKSVVLDLREAADKDLLIRLIMRCDVFVQNLKPGALIKLGIDLARLHRDLPQLISVSISGFHPSGPGADRKAYDLLMQAESGLADITGSPHAAGRVGVSLVDLATGMFAYEAVLEAVLARNLSGRGEAIDVALFDAVAQWMAVPYLLDRYANAAPQRIGLAHPGICPYGVFASADGVEFVLSIQNEAEWHRLCLTGMHLDDLLVDPRFDSNEGRVAHRSLVDGRIAKAFGGFEFAVIETRLNKADVAFAPLHAVEELKSHPDFRVADIAVGEQTIELPIVPGRYSTLGGSVPTLGQHTQEVRDWLDTRT